MEFINDTNFLDQHFLVDKEYIDRFIGICNLNKNDVVLEIGPGSGILTSIIAEKVKKLYVIEKDKRLIPNLKSIKNIDIINDDALKFEWPKVNKIITSLPYSIIEPFIYKLVKTKFEHVYMIMGKHYVDSVINNKINNLALITNVFYDVKKYFDIPAAAFKPSPRVISSAFELTPKIKCNTLELILRNLYILDDKKTKNALIEGMIIAYNLTKREAKSVVSSLEISDEILNREFKNLSNKEIGIVYSKLDSYVNK